MTNNFEALSKDIILPSQQLMTVNYDPIDPKRVTMGDHTKELFHVESGRKILEATLVAPNHSLNNKDFKIKSNKIMFSAAMELNDIFKEACEQEIEPWQFNFEDNYISLTSSGQVAVRNLVSVELVTDFSALGQRRLALALEPTVSTVVEKPIRVKAVEPQNEPKNHNNDNKDTKDVFRCRSIEELSVEPNPLLLMLEQNLTGISLDELVEAFPSADYRKYLAKKINNMPNKRLEAIKHEGKPHLVLCKIIPIRDEAGRDDEVVEAIQKSQLKPDDTL